MSLLIIILLFSLLSPACTNAQRQIPNVSDPLTQYDVFSFQNPRQAEQKMILNIHASPANLEQEELELIASSFQESFVRQQEITCSQNENMQEQEPTLKLHSTEILVNNAIDSFGDEPRTIQGFIDLSYLMTVNYTCIACPVTIDILDTHLRDYYQVPFPSEQYLPCAPRQSNVIADMESSIDIINIPGLASINSLDLIPIGSAKKCNEEKLMSSEFSSYFTMAINGNFAAPDLDEQLRIVEQALVETYNNINVLNPLTCDPYSKIATNATVELRDSSTNRRLSSNIHDGTSATNIIIDDHHHHRRLGYKWKFLWVYFTGSCNGCPQNTCLTNDVSGYATCGGNRRLTSHNPSSCYCADKSASPPTNEEFLEALELRFELLRNETSFDLIDSIVYLIETEVPDSCCGWPVNGNIPVPSTLSFFFEGFVDDYYENGSSPYGYPINCWDVSRQTDFTNAFSGLSDFNEPLSCWNTSAAANMNNMFSFARAFNQDISNFDTSSVTQMGDMFSAADAFNANIGSWDVSKVTDMTWMFNNAISFNQDISGWDTSNAVDMSYMFRGADVFNQDISGWNVSSCTSMASMFSIASAFNQDITPWDTSNVVNMDNMFSLTIEFNQDLSNLDTTSLVSMNSMFSQAIIFNGNLTNWDTSKVESMVNVFDRARLFNGDVTKWNTSSVLDMGYMFTSAEVFNQDVSKWDTSKVTRMENMFRFNYAFNQDLSGWDVSSCTDMSQMFDGEELFNQNLADWNIRKVTDFRSMFLRATMFGQDLCAWGLIDDNVDFGMVSSMFADTNCDNPADPVMGDISWCATC